MSTPVASPSEPYLGTVVQQRFPVRRTARLWCWAELACAEKLRLRRQFARLLDFRETFQFDFLLLRLFQNITADREIFIGDAV